MGGGGASGPAYAYPRHVWSPAGGWWNTPKQWKRNTAIAFGVVTLVSIPLFKAFSARERRLQPPLRHIPSQKWSKHAVEDDPTLKDGYGSKKIKPYPKEAAHH